MVVILLLKALPLNGEREINSFQSNKRPSNATSLPKTKNNNNFTRHVTKVNISDVSSQIEFVDESEIVSKEGMYFIQLFFLL